MYLHLNMNLNCGVKHYKPKPQKDPTYLCKICCLLGWGQCNGTALVIQLELFTKVYIQSPGFQAGEYPQNC
jgi:hypothetical protein